MAMRSAFWSCLLAISLAASVLAQQASATRRIPQLENSSVRVWKSIIAPNQPLSMHRHEAGRVIVALKGGTLRIVQASGESREVQWETGKAYWLDADPPGTTHGDVNPGAEPIEVMVVELKPR
jgi:quercetin dioxygenase-like cupin family protein